MGVLIRIALRNLLEHKAKTLIIGIIVAVGVWVIVVGNAFLARADLGVKKTFTQNFTGDIYVYGKNPGGLPLPVSILFGMAMTGNNDAETPLLPDFNELKQYIDARPEVAKSTGLVTVMAMFNLEDKTEVGKEGEDSEVTTSMLGGAILMGIDPESYNPMFDNVKILEGHYLQPGETGMMISAKRISQTAKMAGTEIKLGDQIILQGFSAAGFQARKLPIVGIFESTSESDANEFMAFADINSVRLLANLTVGGAAEVFVPESARALLDAEEDDIFGMEETVSSGSSYASLEALADEAAAAPAIKAEADSGAWQFILVSLKNPGAARMTIAALNAYFVKNGINAAAGDWKGAASPFSQSIDLVRFVLSIVILILVVVAIVIIMNTLVVSVLERTGEIGTMRALGAQKGFIWKMFLVETLCVTLVFGAVGILLAGLSMLVVNLIGFQATNSFLQVLFGGQTLSLSLSLGGVLLTLVLVALVSLLAHIYPVLVALGIQPVRAMQTE